MTQTLSKILYVEDGDDIEIMVGRDVMYDWHSVVALLHTKSCSTFGSWWLASNQGLFHTA